MQKVELKFSTKKGYLAKQSPSNLTNYINTYNTDYTMCKIACNHKIINTFAI